MGSHISEKTWKFEKILSGNHSIGKLQNISFPLQKALETAVERLFDSGKWDRTQGGDEGRQIFCICTPKPLTKVQISGSNSSAASME